MLFQLGVAKSHTFLLISPFCFQNYNKSRIDSSRGAKDVEMTLDGATIFRGEMARACGGIVGGSEAFGDVRCSSLNFILRWLFHDVIVLCAHLQTILFTVDEEILDRVADNDQAFEADVMLEQELFDDIVEEEQERPSTADSGLNNSDVRCTSVRDVTDFEVE